MVPVRFPSVRIQSGLRLFFFPQLVPFGPTGSHQVQWAASLPNCHSVWDRDKQKRFYTLSVPCGLFAGWPWHQQKQQQREEGGRPLQRNTKGKSACCLYGGWFQHICSHIGKCPFPCTQRMLVFSDSTDELIPGIRFPIWLCSRKCMVVLVIIYQHQLVSHNMDNA